MTTDLTFDDERHEYKLAGRTVPGVTSVIRSHVPAWNSGEFFLQRGRAVHAAVALAVEGRLDVSSLDPRIVNRVQSIMNFITDLGLHTFSIEKRLASRLYGFAGTIDMAASDQADAVSIFDWKSSIEATVILQLSAYCLLWKENYGLEMKNACAVRCDDKGKYHCKWFSKRELRDGANVFLAFLTTHSWKAKHNLNKTG